MQILFVKKKSNSGTTFWELLACSSSERGKITDLAGINKTKKTKLEFVDCSDLSEMKSLFVGIAFLSVFDAILGEDLRLVNLDPPEAQQYIDSKDTSLKYAPKVDSNVPAVRFLGNEPHNVLEDIYLANQYHGQDGLGGYLYGYSVPDIAKTEKKKAGGDLRGAYNYIAGNGQEIKVEYWDDGHGFHQVDNVPKILPKQIDDLPEVKAAKEEHLRLWHEQAERNSRPVASPYDSEGNYAQGPLSPQGQAQTLQLVNQYQQQKQQFPNPGQSVHYQGGQNYQSQPSQNVNKYQQSGGLGGQTGAGSYSSQSASAQFGSGQSGSAQFGSGQSGSGQLGLGGASTGGQFKVSGQYGGGPSSASGSQSGGIGQLGAGKSSVSGQFGGSQSVSGQPGGSGQYGASGQFGGSQSGGIGQLGAGKSSASGQFGGSQSVSGQPGGSGQYGASGQFSGSQSGGIGQPGAGKSSVSGQFGGSQSVSGQPGLGQYGSGSVGGSQSVSGQFGGSGKYGAGPSSVSGQFSGSQSVSGQPGASGQFGGSQSGGSGQFGVGPSSASGQFGGSKSVSGQYGSGPSSVGGQFGTSHQSVSGQYGGGKFSSGGQYQGSASESSGQYSGNEDEGQWNDNGDEGQWKADPQEEQGPPKGFFYNFDYPVGIIVQKDGGSIQKREGNLKDIYSTNKAEFERQLQQGSANSASGYLVV